MNNVDADWKVYRPHIAGVLVWFALTLAFCAAAGTVLPLVGAPKWVMFVFSTLAFFAIINGIAIARSRIRYNDTQIESRYFRHIKRRWDDAEAWSRLGDNGSLFVKFTDGVVIGSDGWALNDNDIDELVPVLTERIGKPKTNGDTVMPWFLRILGGGLLP